MTNHETLRKIRWADASFESVVVDYDRITLEVTEEAGRRALLHVDEHIGLSWIGHWDEAIIESASLLADSALLKDALVEVQRRNGAFPGPGGGTRDFSGNWLHVSILFIDGTSMNLLGQRLRVEFPAGDAIPRPFAQ